jgi:hypothetical protein
MTKATIEGGKLSLDLYDLLGSLTDQARLDLIDTLAVREEVIHEVANQIIDGYTTAGSHGPTSFGGNPDATYGLDAARLRIAKASSDIAAKEIERMGDEIRRAKASMDDAWNKYHELVAERRRYA